MLAAVLSLVIAALLAVKVNASFRFAAFVILLLLLMPCTAYIIAGLSLVLSGLSGADIVKDFFSIAAQVYTEPFRMVRPPIEGMRPLNPSFALTGILVILSSLVLVGQIAAYIARQRQQEDNSIQTYH